MSDRRRLAVSRREVLGAVGTIGSVGALSGAGTFAYLSDEERFENSLQAGALDLEMDCVGGDCTTTGDGEITFEFPDLEPGDSGTEEIVLTQTGNPAWIWLGSTCPDEALERAIQVEVTYDRDCDGTVEKRFDGPLFEVLLDLATGVKLTDQCLLGEETACITLDWSFPNEPGVEQYAGESLTFTFQFGAIQCRHNDGSVRPFAARECTVERRGISFIEVWTCTDAEPALLGKVELSEAYPSGCPALNTAGIGENWIEPGIYDLPVDDDCEDTGYDIHVTDVTLNPDGEAASLAFEILDENGDPGPDICRVVVKSGREELVYDAEDLAPQSNSTEGEVGGAWL